MHVLCMYVCMYVQEETFDHLTSGCQILAKNEYSMRHDKVCAHLHYAVCKSLCIETTNGTHAHTHARTHAQTSE
jgi:hypothetical protein